ncbi:MAG: Holliday junction branch migration protein RuvA [Chloroflexi bacterium]|nr:MAG: Holliday junction branch migration protein RuvA [Chloroflexota bacterium]
MISSIKGIVEKKGKDFLLVRVNGLGFKVFVPSYLLDESIHIGEEVRLLTYLHFKESELALYGFAEEEELSFFELLITVPGVGPKAALALLSHLSPSALQEAIASERPEILTRVPGIGSKTARNIVFHLKDKVQAVMPATVPPALARADEEVIAALTSLGYSLVEAQRAVQSIPREVTEVEERLRLALAYFASKG